MTLPIPNCTQWRANLCYPNYAVGIDVKNKFYCSMIIPTLNRGLWLVVVSFLTSFNQWECFMSAYNSYPMPNLFNTKPFFVFGYFCLQVHVHCTNHRIAPKSFIVLIPRLISSPINTFWIMFYERTMAFDICLPKAFAFPIPRIFSSLILFQCGQFGRNFSTEA